MTKYGIFRGNKLVGRVIFNNLSNAEEERDEWNAQFREYNEKVKANPSLGKPVTYVEVKEYGKKRQTREQKMQEMFE